MQAAAVKKQLNKITNDGGKQMTIEDRIRLIMSGMKVTREQAEEIIEENVVPLELGRLVIRAGLQDHVRALAARLAAA